MRKLGTVFAWLFAALVAIAVFNYVRYVHFFADTESVTIPSGDIELAGTLVLPDDVGRHDAVIILHGSGPESWKEPSYLASANVLVRAGFAVLLYDKRGVGDSGGDFDSALYRDFIDDAIAAVRYLRSRDDIASVALFGNSESGWFTPEIARRTGDISFVFNRVGPPLSWIETNLWEVRNEYLDAGVSERNVAPLLDSIRRRWEYYIAAGRDSRLAEGAERDALDAELADLRERIPFADQVLPERILPYDAAAYMDLSANLSYDPRPFLERLDVPVYYVFGSEDVNIPTETSVAYLQTLQDRGRKVEFTVFNGVGHPLAGWSGVLTAGYVPAYLELVSAWTAEQVR